MKIGAEIKPRVNFTILQPPVPRGAFNFSGQFTADPNNVSNTGLGTADFLLGVVQSAQLSSFINDTFQQPGMFYYVQDDFKVSKQAHPQPGPALRVRAPTRWRNTMPKPISISPRTRWTSRTAARIRCRRTSIPQIAVNRNAPRSLVPNQKQDFGPRIGFAYNLFKNTVIRGGYGIFYSSYEAGPLSIPNPGNNPPFFEQTNYPNRSVLAAQSDREQSLAGISGGRADESGPAVVVLGRSELQQSLRAALAIQRAAGTGMEHGLGNRLRRLEGNQAVRISQRQSGRSLPLTQMRILPTCGRGRIWATLPYWCACNSSTYHSLQTKIEKRFSNGLELPDRVHVRQVHRRSIHGLAGLPWRRIRAQLVSSRMGKRTVRFRSASTASSTALPTRFRSAKESGSVSDLNGAGRLLMGGWELQGIQSYTSGAPLHD